MAIDDYVVAYYTAKEWEREGGEDWHAEAIRTNPSYTGWSVGDDYMYGPKADKGWASGVENESWDDDMCLDELNECVHFQFDIHRESRDCAHCEGHGWSTEAMKIYRGIVEKQEARGDYDSSARYNGTVDRCADRGIPHDCPECEGVGSISFGETRLELQLWFLVPRKGCSRGVRILSVTREQLPGAYAWLRRAAARNAENFSRVPGDGK